MKPHASLAIAATVLSLSLSALPATAQDSTPSSSSEAKPVTVPTPMGPHLNESPSTVVTGTIEGITDKGPAAATENLAGNFLKSKPAAVTKIAAKKTQPKVKGAKIKAKGVVQALTAKPQASAPAQANASVDAKIQTN